MDDHFNKLTPAEAERLAMLAEECGEVIQAITKILRHGYDSHHPSRPGITNKRLLNKEMIDVYSVWREMEMRDGVSAGHLDDVYHAWRKKLKYSHHQEPIE